MFDKELDLCPSNDLTQELDELKAESSARKAEDNFSKEIENSLS